MKNLTLLFIFGVCSLIAIHSSGQSKGYIITQEEDTLHGYIEKANYKICEFKQLANDPFQRYYPGKIKAYRTKDQYFVSERIFHKNEFTDIFLKVLIQTDSINLYYYPKNRNQKFYISLINGNLLGLYNDEKKIIFHTTNNTSAQITHTDEYFAKYDFYRFTLMDIMHNCNNIIYNKLFVLEYDKDEIVSIIKEYIQSTCSTNNCILYEDQN